MSADILPTATNLASVAANFAAVGALLFAAFTYRNEQRKNRLAQEKIRQDTALALIKESRNSEKLQLALNILDHIMISPKDDWGFPPEHYNISNLSRILRVHGLNSPLDAGEREIREAFWELYEFLIMVNSYLSSGVIRPINLAYFFYYFEKLKESEAILSYFKTYGDGTAVQDFLNNVTR